MLVGTRLKNIGQVGIGAFTAESSKYGYGERGIVPPAVFLTATCTMLFKENRLPKKV